MKNSTWIPVAATVCAVLATSWLLAADGPAKAAPNAPSAATRPAAKELSDSVKTGLAWLAKNQMENGAWAQGEESAAMGSSAAKIKDLPNVADTCMAMMALHRGGSTPKDGPYKGNLLLAVKFLCNQIEESDANSLSITSVQGTRTQMKLGTYIDTFLAAQVLAELKDSMPDEKTAQRVRDDLEKVVRKMEKNQGKDGQWKNEGWAPGLAQAQAAKALNVVSASGVKVDEKVRQNAETYARKEYAGAKAGKTPGNDAGVALYSAGGQIAAMQSSANNNDAMKADLDKTVASPASKPAEKEAAKVQLARIADNEKDLRDAQNAVVAKMTDQKFVSGFGSNGGEEFLSYLNLGESLFQRGGPEWQKWDKMITDNLNNVQNKDGTWTGHHCITGRTFCTSAALMVLTIDRSPMPAAAKIKGAGR